MQNRVDGYNVIFKNWELKGFALFLTLKENRLVYLGVKSGR